MSSSLLYGDFLADVLAGTAGPVLGTFRGMLSVKEVAICARILRLARGQGDNTVSRGKLSGRHSATPCAPSPGTSTTSSSSSLPSSSSSLPSSSSSSLSVASSSAASATALRSSLPSPSSSSSSTISIVSTAQAPGSSEHAKITSEQFALEIYEHLVLRKGRFFRFSDLRKYLPSRNTGTNSSGGSTSGDAIDGNTSGLGGHQSLVAVESANGIPMADSDEEKHLLDAALGHLETAGLLNFPFGTNRQKMNRDAIAQELLFSERCILAKAELQQLARLLGLKVANVSGLTKASLLEQIRKASLNQRTLFGGRVSLIRPLSKVLAISGIQSSSPSSAVTSTLLVLDKPALTLVRMLHRVYSLSASPQSCPNLDCPNDGLMVRFKKCEYVKYRTNVDVQDIYSSREEFDAFERALALEASICDENDECDLCAERDNIMSESSESGNDSDCICLGSTSAAVSASSATLSAPSAGPASLSSSDETLEAICITCATERAATQISCLDTSRVAPLRGIILSDCPWLKGFHAGAVYARIIWHGIAELERCRNYKRAMDLLQVLLRSEYAPQRRGRMWIRLLVDAKHAAESAINLESVDRMVRWCQESLNDRFVGGGDRITLEKKLATLTKKRERRCASVTRVPAAASSGSSLATIIVPDNSDDDFEPSMSRKTRAKKIFRRSMPSERAKAAASTSAKAERRAAPSAPSRSEKLLDVPRRFIVGRPTNKKTGEKSRFVDYDEGHACTVESLCLQNYGQSEHGAWDGIHCEGSPLRMLFFLLLWDDVIFWPNIPGTFLTPFQNGPLDMDSATCFSRNRESQLVSALRRIAGETQHGLAKRVRESWFKNRGKACRGMNWCTDPRLLVVCAAATGGLVLSEIFRALASDFHHFSGGLPDLFLWRWNDETTINCSGEGDLTICSNIFDSARLREQQISQRTESDAVLHLDSKYLADLDAIEAALLCKPDVLQSKFVEVKGPRDTLMARQVAWLHILVKAAARTKGLCSVEVCHVEERAWASAKSLKKKTKRKKKKVSLTGNPLSPSSKSSFKKRKKTTKEDYSLTTDY